MRTPEELAADISGYRLETPPTVTTVELRSAEDAKRYFKTHPEAGGLLEKMPISKMRFPCAITSGDPHPKTDHAEVSRMQGHIERYWTCAEIILYESLPDSGRQNKQKDILSHLRNEAYAYAGAAVAASIIGTKMSGGLIVDYGDVFEHTIKELREELHKHGNVSSTLDEILSITSETKRQQSEVIQKAADAARKGGREGARAAVQKQLPITYDKCMNAKPGDEHPALPKPRRKGAGRKPTYDLDGRQTAAVLDLAKKHGRTVPTNADAAAIIRKGKCDFENPYTKPASLLTSARREAERREAASGKRQRPK